MGKLERAVVGVLAVGAVLLSGPSAWADGGQADLAASMAGPSQVFIGDTARYGITVFNHGPDEASGILFTAKLSGPGLYDAAASSSVCHTDGRSVACKLGKIPPGFAVVFDVVVDTTAAGTLVQDFTVTAIQDDANPSNNSGVVTTAVLPPTADLAASVTGPTTAIAGDTLAVAASASNLGPLAATGVVLTDTFSGPGTFAATASDSRCSASGAQTITCSLGPLAAGAAAQITIAFTLTAPGTLSQAVHVSAASPPDPNPGNDSAGLTTTVEPHAADLSLTLGNSPANPSYTFEQLVWQFEVDNHGPLAPNNVVVTGTLSGPATWDASQSSPGCTVSGMTITCNVGSLFVGGGAILGVVAHPKPGVVGASFTVTSELPDQNLSNNSVTAPSVTVLPSADVRVVVCCLTPVAGGVTVHLFASNAGPDADTGVILTAGWSPSGVGGATLAGVTPSQGTCSISASSLTCSLGTLPSGGSATVDVSLQAPSGTSVTTTASITGDLFDYNQSNNSASVTVVVS